MAEKDIFSSVYRLVAYPGATWLFAKIILNR